MANNINKSERLNRSQTLSFKYLNHQNSNSYLYIEVLRNSYKLPIWRIMHVAATLWNGI